MAAKPARSRTRSEKLLRLDGRVRLARVIRDTRDSLLASLPQPPGPTDACLCERAAIISGHLLELDRKALREGSLSATETRLYTTLSGQHNRIMKALKAARSTRPAGPSLSELFPDREAVA